MDSNPHWELLYWCFLKWLAASDHNESLSEVDPELTESAEKDYRDGPLFVSSMEPTESSSETRKAHRHEHNADRSPNPAMYPAALKIVMRNHIRTLCATSHCVDSFVIYLSSPTRTHDGASLLWDADHNGQVTKDLKSSFWAIHQRSHW